MPVARARVQFVVAAAAVVACWASDGVAPLADAARGALDPVDFARDYVAARARLDDGRRGPPPDGEAANDRAMRLGVPPVALLGAPYYIHPPPALLLVSAVAPLPWRGAAVAWLIGSLVALVWLTRSLLTLATAAEGRPPRAVPIALVSVALGLWPPVLHNLEKGQWSLLLAALMAAGACALAADRPRRAGVLFGLAASLKATPIVLLAWLIVRHRRAGIAMSIAVGSCTLVTIAYLGFDPWRAFFAGAARNLAVWTAWKANTASLGGVYARLFVGGPFARAVVDAPAVATVAFNLTALALLGVAVRAAWTARAGAAGRGPAAERHAGASEPHARAIAALWLTLPVLLNPLGWSHVVVMLLAPLTTMAVREGLGGSESAEKPCGILAATAIFALFSIPRERLATLAGPLPVAPGLGLVLGLHAYAALALFIGLTRAAGASNAIIHTGGATPPVESKSERAVIARRR